MKNKIDTWKLYYQLFLNPEKKIILKQMKNSTIIIKLLLNITKELTKTFTFFFHWLDKISFICEVQYFF